MRRQIRKDTLTQKRSNLLYTKMMTEMRPKAGQETKRAVMTM